MECIMSRYEIISKSNKILSEENCPLIIIGMALTVDNNKNSILAQIKYQNLINKCLKAVYISIECYGIDGEPLHNLDKFIYLDLNIASYEVFGSDIPVYLPDNKTRKIEIRCNKIIFDDDSVWDNKGGKSFDVELDREPLENDFLDDKSLFDELKRELRDNNIPSSMLYSSYENNGIRLCTCGCFNMKDDSICFSCGKSIDWWKDITSKSHLTKSIEEYNDQQRIKEEQERIRKAQNKRKATKYGIIAASIFACILMVTFVWLKFIKPSVQYKKAEEYFENGEYEEAINIYKELNDYKDSSQKLSVVKKLKKEEDTYAYAQEKFRNREYYSAIENFKIVSDFKDSTYYIGESYYQRKEYEEAIVWFEKVKDHSEFYDESMKRVDECYYNIGISYVKQGKFESAKEYFGKTNYQNSTDYLALIDQIENEGWIGIYRRDDDNTQWMQVLCVVNDDLTYAYEVYRQSNIIEYYSTNLSVNDEGKIVLEDEFTGYNIENNGERKLSSSTHLFQEDKSVYNSNMMGGYGSFHTARVTSKTVLSKENENLILDVHCYKEYIFEDRNEEVDYQYFYIKQ